MNVASQPATPAPRGAELGACKGHVSVRRAPANLHAAEEAKKND